MSDFLDVRAELDRLERSLERHLSSALLETSRTVLYTMQVRPHSEPRWTERISPFLVLYPLLQSQAWSEAPTASARTANEVHLLVLIHNFIDDRLVDGESPLKADEIVLAKQALLIALRLASEASLLPPPVARIWIETYERYSRAQVQRFEAFEKVTTEDGFDPCERSVIDRIGLGQLTVIAACHAAGQAHLRPMLGEAFEALVVGLQWEDDLVDWPDDLLADQQNLLLARLVPGAIPREGNGKNRQITVRQSILDQGTYWLALRKAVPLKDRCNFGRFDS